MYYFHLCPFKHVDFISNDYRSLRMFEEVIIRRQMWHVFIKIQLNIYCCWIHSHTAQFCLFKRCLSGGIICHWCWKDAKYAIFMFFYQKRCLCNIYIIYMFILYINIYIYIYLYKHGSLLFSQLLRVHSGAFPVKWKKKCKPTIQECDSSFSKTFLFRAQGFHPAALWIT